MATSLTPLRRWLERNAAKPNSGKPATISALARELDVSRNRLQFWVRGDCMPSGIALIKLLEVTGLPLMALLPSPESQRKRRRAIRGWVRASRARLKARLTEEILRSEVRRQARGKGEPSRRRVEKILKGATRRTTRRTAGARRGQ